MLDSSFNGGIIYDLNKINDIANEVDGDFICGCGVESCPGCERGDAIDSQMNGASDIDGNPIEGQVVGAAGTNDDNLDADAMLGCKEGDMVSLVVQTMMDNAKAAKRNIDPLKFFKEPLSYDMYSPETKYN